MSIAFAIPQVRLGRRAVIAHRGGRRHNGLGEVATWQRVVGVMERHGLALADDPLRINLPDGHPCRRNLALALYLAVTACDRSRKGIARAANVSDWTAISACRAVEDAREDNSEIERLLTTLERELSNGR